MKVPIRAITILVVACMSACGDVVTSHYASYQDAVNDDLFERGWLPEIIPSTTTNIKTTNNLDLNTSKGHFYLPKSDIAIFESQLTKMPDGKRSYSYGTINNDPTWYFEVDDETGHVTYVLSNY